MLERVEPKLFKIRPSQFIKDDGKWYEITEARVEDGYIHLKLSDGLELIIKEEDLENYEFLKLQGFRDDVVTKLVHSCQHCSRPVAYDSIEQIEGHLDRCLFNNANKSCVMCEHLKVFEEAPYPRNLQNWSNPDIEWAFGNYRKPYCKKFEQYIDEALLYASHEDCFVVDTEQPEIEYTEDYKKWLELSTQLDEEWRVEEAWDEDVKEE